MPNTSPDLPLAKAAVRIQTGSRVHFGLLDVHPPYGGIGCMIDQPRTIVSVSPADRFECPRHLDRVDPIINRIAGRLGLNARPHLKIEISGEPGQHTGLGSGTQIAFAVADAIQHCLNNRPPSQNEIRAAANRGNRSRVGSIGYFAGGLISEWESKTSQRSIERVEMPADWRILICRPIEPTPQFSGESEKSGFDRLPVVAPPMRQRMMDLVERRILPSAATADFETFSQSIRQYNSLSGELFRTVQGGTYQSEAVALLIDRIRRQGVSGVGQSSWGPGVFAILSTALDAENLSQNIQRDARVVSISAFDNKGRTRVAEPRSPR